MTYIISTNDFPQSPQNRTIMLLKIFSLSEKLKNHFLQCGGEKNCGICVKTLMWVDIFLEYQKDKNKILNITKIIDNDFIESVIFGNDVMMVI